MGHVQKGGSCSVQSGFGGSCAVYHNHHHRFTNGRLGDDPGWIDPGSILDWIV